MTFSICPAHGRHGAVLVAVVRNAAWLPDPIQPMNLDVLIECHIAVLPEGVNLTRSEPHIDARLAEILYVIPSVNEDDGN